MVPNSCTLARLMPDNYKQLPITLAVHAGITACFVHPSRPYMRSLDLSVVSRTT